MRSHATIKINRFWEFHRSFSGDHTRFTRPFDARAISYWSTASIAACISSGVLGTSSRFAVRSRVAVIDVA
jgi:hypothetical protein